MRYVIVCLLNDEVKQFHARLVEDVCVKFNVRPQKLSAHFTIKAPFESEDISDIIEISSNFCEKYKSEEVELQGFGHFRNDVIFMDIKPSAKALVVNEQYINELKKINDLTWKKNEFKEKKYHCTIVSRRISSRFSEIWEYVNKHKYSYKTNFDNITIMIWQDNTWKIYKQFYLRVG